MKATIVPEVNVFLVFSIVALMFTVIIVTVFVFSIFETRCWKDVKAEFNNFSGRVPFVPPLLGKDKFYLVADLNPECVVGIWFPKRAGECGELCFRHFQGEREKCAEPCYQKCRNGCILIIPKIDAWWEPLKLWEWIKKSPLDTIKMMKHKVEIYHFGDYSFQYNGEPLLSTDERKAYCLEFEKGGNNVYTITSKEIGKGEINTAEECRSMEAS